MWNETFWCFGLPFCEVELSQWSEELSCPFQRSKVSLMCCKSDGSRAFFNPKLGLNFSRSLVANSLGGMDNASISRASAPRPSGEFPFQRPRWMDQSIPLLPLSSPRLVATVANSRLVRMKQRCWRVPNSDEPFLNYLNFHAKNQYPTNLIIFTIF